MSVAARRYRRGLVVGKFCPLHRGHMHLIRTALDVCEEVLVISYTKPEFPHYDIGVRRDWIAQLFPGVRSLVVDDASLAEECRSRGIVPAVALPPNDAPDAVHRAFTAWLCWVIAGIAVDAVFTSEDYGDGFALALSDYFTVRTGRRWPVAHVCVDRARALVPTSGSAIRRDPHAHRDFLDPRVYADFVGRICLLGGESSGKTTLAAALAGALDTAWVPEAGRAIWEEKGGTLRYDDMREIAEAQVALEQALAGQASRWLVCDGSALTTACYSEFDYGQVDPAVAALARRAYAFTFVCAPDFPFVQDGTRRDATFRQRQYAWYLAALDRAQVKYTLLCGPLEERVRKVCETLARGGHEQACTARVVY